MWVADMEFATAPSVLRAMRERLEHPCFGYFEYPQEYYDRIAWWHERRNGLVALNPVNICYDNGVLGGVANALAVVCSRGDKVLVHAPTYTGLTNTLKNAGYDLVTSWLQRDAEGVWRMDYEDMERKLATREVHAAILCSPHNPTGRVWERWELERAMGNAGYDLVTSWLQRDAEGVWRMDYEDMERKLATREVHAAIRCSPHKPTGRVWVRWELERAMGLFRKYDVYVISDEIWTDIVLGHAAIRCSPHKPTGRVWVRWELERAMGLFRKYDVYVISDEIWTDIVLGGSVHIPTQSVSDDARMRTVALSAPSKTFNFAGIIGSYRVVYNPWVQARLAKQASLSHYNMQNVLSMHALLGAYSDESLGQAGEFVALQHAKRALHACAFGCIQRRGRCLGRRVRLAKQASLSHYNMQNVLSMHALLGAYSDEGAAWVDELREVLGRNARIASEFFEGIAGVDFARPQGTYMLFLDCDGWCAAHGMDIDELLRSGVEVGVLWQDGRPFGGDSLSHYNMQNVLSMHALLGAYSDEGAAWVDELREVLGRNARIASEFFEGIAGVDFARPQGTYMLFLDCDGWCAAHGMDIDELLRSGVEVGVLWQDGRPFGGDRTIRINLALPTARLREALERLAAYVFVREGRSSLWRM